MKTKGIVLSLMASTLINIPSSFAKEYQSSTKLTQAKKSKFEFYPVKLSKTEVKGGLFLNGNSYIQLTKSPVLTVQNFKYQSLKNNEVGIKLILSKKENKSLEQITKKYINTKLAIVFNNEVLMAPAIKSIVGSDEIELSFKSIKKFENLLVDLKQV